MIYYAGFYLVMALLRTIGRGLVYLNKTECQALCSRPGLTTLKPGVYAISIVVGAKTSISLSKTNYSGFHEGFWRYADDSLAGLSGDIAIGQGMYLAFSPTYRQNAILSVENLRSWLGDDGVTARGVGWMSSLRNELNYRLARRAWSPTYRQDGVEVARLRQDVVAIARGTSKHLGAQLRMDNDVRAMVERIGMLFYQMSGLSEFPRAL
jgi:hypothetical protein